MRKPYPFLMYSSDQKNTAWWVLCLGFEFCRYKETVSCVLASHDGFYFDWLRKWREIFLANHRA